MSKTRKPQFKSGGCIWFFFCWSLSNVSSVLCWNEMMMLMTRIILRWEHHSTLVVKLFDSLLNKKNPMLFGYLIIFIAYFFDVKMFEFLHATINNLICIRIEITNIYRYPILFFFSFIMGFHFSTAENGILCLLFTKTIIKQRD